MSEDLLRVTSLMVAFKIRDYLVKEGFTQPNIQQITKGSQFDHYALTWLYTNGIEHKIRILVSIAPYVIQLSSSVRLEESQFDLESFAFSLSRENWQDQPEKLDEWLNAATELMIRDFSLVSTPVDMVRYFRE